MRHQNIYILRKLSIFRIVRATTLGSGLLYANNHKLKSTVAVLIPKPLRRESVYLPWKIGEEMLSVPSSDEKEAFVVSKDNPKPCCGCLGRDTIANAAASVAPAVVNISLQLVIMIWVGVGIGFQIWVGVGIEFQIWVGVGIGEGGIEGGEEGGKKKEEEKKKGKKSIWVISFWVQTMTQIIYLDLIFFEFVTK
ncbi:hypothetical protein UlMin_007749 [Ulmus minor]